MTSRNTVKERFRKGEVAYGVHVKLPAVGLVDVAGNTGSDFVKFDQYHLPFSPEMMAAMVAAARANRLTPWVRCRNDAYEIMTMLDMGIEAITVPSVGSVAEARAAVAATRYLPRGVRESNRPLSRRWMKDADYFAWAAEELLVCVSIENREGLENYREIIRTEGVDVIATGRGDISLALGVPNDRDHQPQVLEAQKRVLMDALDAGKQVTMTYPCTPRGIEEAQAWVDQGLRVVTLEAENRVLNRVWAESFAEIRRGDAAAAAR